MTATIISGVDELTAGQLGEQAAQAVRALAYLTRPGIGALAGPADAAELIAALARISAGLPQLTSQLAGWLHGEECAGRLRVDDCSPPTEPAEAVTEAVTEVTAARTQAAGCAHAAGRALDAAAQTLARLAAPGGSEPGGRP